MSYGANALVKEGDDDDDDDGGDDGNSCTERRLAFLPWQRLVYVKHIPKLRA
jgi:hypothetical protein